LNKAGIKAQHHNDLQRQIFQSKNKNIVSIINIFMGERKKLHVRKDVKKLHQAFVFEISIKI